MNLLAQVAEGYSSLPPLVQYAVVPVLVSSIPSLGAWASSRKAARHTSGLPDVVNLVAANVTSLDTKLESLDTKLDTRVTALDVQLAEHTHQHAVLSNSVCTNDECIHRSHWEGGPHN